MLSPLDGRYRGKIGALSTFFSEEALNKYRLEVEIKYFIALSKEAGIKQLPRVSVKQEKALLSVLKKYDDKEAAAIKKIESVTNHDVKAVEYYLKKKLEKISGLKKYTEFVHFGLTSEDVNNLSYGMMVNSALTEEIIPGALTYVSDIKKIAVANRTVKMLSLTHGQPATASTMGKEMMVFVDRLNRQIDQMKAFLCKESLVEQSEITVHIKPLTLSLSGKHLVVSL